MGPCPAQNAPDSPAGQGVGASGGFTPGELERLRLSDKAMDEQVEFGEGSVLKAIWPVFICEACVSREGGGSSHKNGVCYRRCQICGHANQFRPLAYVVWMRGEQVALKPDELVRLNEQGA